MFFLLALPFLTSFLVTYISVYFFKFIAFRYDIIDYPGGALKQHKTPTPYLGGVSVFLGFLISVLWFLPFQKFTFFLIAGLLILLILGLFDDIYVSSPLQKIIGQSVAASIFLIGGFILKTFFLSSFINFIISFFWILSVVNAFNLVDVMDGLATTLAITATTGFLFIAIQFNLLYTSLFLMCFLGALIAFFLHNRPIAGIYLGDAGSHVVGGVLAVTPFFFNWSDHSLYGYFAPLMILMIPLCEVLFLIYIRKLNKIPFYYGSSHHYCHYLRKRGWSAPEILNLSFFYSLLCGVSAFLLACNVISLEIFLLCATMLIFFWVFFVYCNTK